MIDLSYPALLDLFREHITPKRSESASFLIWYLENYYRLDTLEATDSVCDNNNDKGIDGVYVNDNDSTITIFQSKISQNANSTMGDKQLREFAGTLRQLSSESAINDLVSSAGKAEIASLAKRLDLVNKIRTHTLRGEFLSNIDLDSNGRDFLKATKEITFIGKSGLISTYISDERDTPIHTDAVFDIAGFDIATYTAEANAKAIIAPLRASELVKLQGISNQSLYAYNVRGPLGRTKVNRDISNSIGDAALHKYFPLFHNGIIIICSKCEQTPDQITIGDYWVVNGCQSLTALSDNTAKLTDNLRILSKIILMEPKSELASKVTDFSNNQNGQKARDSRSNNPIQIRLQNEFLKDYKGQYSFEIKQGDVQELGIVIPNEVAGLYLMSFDLQQPWATHRRYQVFDDKHADLFGRPEVTADRIVMCQVLVEAIDKASEGINNKECAKYVLTRYCLVYYIRQIIEKDGLRDAILSSPRTFVRNKQDRDRFRECLHQLACELVIDFNYEVDQLGDDFGYRDKLRDEQWVKELGKQLITSHLKDVKRGKALSLESAWKSGDQIWGGLLG